MDERGTDDMDRHLLLSDTGCCFECYPLMQHMHTPDSAEYYCRRKSILDTAARERAAALNRKQRLNARREK